MYIVYDKNPKNLHNMMHHIQNSEQTNGDAIYVLTMQSRQRKARIFQIPTKVDTPVVFYRTPQTIDIAEKPIEIFLLNSKIFGSSGKNFIEIVIPHPHLQTNFRAEVFQSARQTLLMFVHDFDSWRESEAMTRTGRIMPRNKEVYMLNYIGHNLGVFVLHYVYDLKTELRHPSIYWTSNDRIHRELFISLKGRR